MRSQVFLCGTVVLFSASHVFAGGLPTGVYAGIAAGVSSSDADTGSLVTNPARCTLVGAVCNANNDGQAWKVYAGYPITNKFSIEAEYADLGRIVDGSVSQGGVNDAYSQKTAGVGLSLIGKVQPLADKPLSLYGKAGVFHWINEADATFSPAVAGFGTTVSRKENDTDPVLGLGMEYALNKHWSVRTSWDRYFNVGESKAMLDEGTSTWRTLDADVDVYTIGASYHF